MEHHRDFVVYKLSVYKLVNVFADYSCDNTAGNSFHKTLQTNKCNYKCKWICNAESYCKILNEFCVVEEQHKATHKE